MLTKVSTKMPSGVDFLVSIPHEGYRARLKREFMLTNTFKLFFSFKFPLGGPRIFAGLLEVLSDTT